MNKMKPYGYKSIFIVALLLLCQPVFAVLSINIVQGVDKPYPIAIVPFGTGGIESVIASDLTMSGQFAVMPTSQLPQQPHSASAVQWSSWQAVNHDLEFIVVGNVSPGSQPGTYHVMYQLVSMLGHRSLMGKQFSNIPSSQLRSLAHFISDQIYQTITGVRGIFSTRLAYVDVSNPVASKPVFRLMIADADGHNPRMLLQQVDNPIASPIWSPDGKQLAYVSYLHNRMTIYAITLATGQRQVIASYQGINSAPDWSPDGNTMAMALSKGDGSQTNLYLMNIRTRQLTQLTNFATNTSPRFSPDGKQLVFTSDRSGQPQIYQMDLASHQVTRLTFQGLKNFSADYTPDGKTIVFMYQASGDSSICLAALNIATGQMSVLTNGTLDKSPSIAPNGQMVVYANYDGANGSLAETSINGKIHLQLPEAQGSVQSPAWSPFLTQ